MLQPKLILSHNVALFWDRMLKILCAWNKLNPLPVMRKTIKENTSTKHVVMEICQEDPVHHTRKRTPTVMFPILPSLQGINFTTAKNVCALASEYLPLYWSMNSLQVLSLTAWNQSFSRLCPC